MAAPLIWQQELPAAAWQLLWWLISRMDPDTAEIREGWRAHAARELKKHRTWIEHCAKKLEEAGLIETAPRQRYARVIVQNLKG